MGCAGLQPGVGDADPGRQCVGRPVGRRRIFTIGIVLFTSASLLCGVSPALGLLIVARAFQGIGAAMLIPQSLAIISASFPDERLCFKRAANFRFLEQTPFLFQKSKTPAPSRVRRWTV